MNDNMDEQITNEWLEIVMGNPILFGTEVDISDSRPTEDELMDAENEEWYVYNVVEKYLDAIESYGKEYIYKIAKRIKEEGAYASDRGF